MKRSDEILQAALPYIDEPQAYRGFIFGADWADKNPHWISVKDRKPELKYSADNLKYSDSVIVTNGEYRISARWMHYTLGGWYGWYDDSDEELEGVTHWAPLPQVPKKGGYSNSSNIGKNKQEPADKIEPPKNDIKT